MAHRRRRHRRHYAVMANPRRSKDWQSHALVIAKMAAVVGGSAIAGGYALNWLSAKVPTVNPYVKAIGKAGVGVGSALALAGTLPPDVLSGLAIAGVTAGGMDLFALLRPHAAPSSTASTPAALALGGGSAGLYNAVQPRMVAGMRR